MKFGAYNMTSTIVRHTPVNFEILDFGLELNLFDTSIHPLKPFLTWELVKVSGVIPLIAYNK